MGRTKKLNIEMFKSLCGEDAFSNIAILTSMWSTDELSAEFVKQVAREEQLKEEYLTDILSEDGLLRRLKSEDSSTIDVASAKEIFQELFDSWKDDKITLRIQHELVNDLVPLSETTAGKALSFHMDEVYQHYEVELSKLSEAIKEARASTRGSTFHHQDEATATILEQQTTVQRYLDQLRADQDAMKMSLLEVYAEEKERLTAQMSAMESRWKQELASREREQALREQVLAEMRASALTRDAGQQQRQERQEREAAQRQQLAVFSAEQDRRRKWEARYHAQLVQQGRWREEGYRAELEKMRKEMKDMKADFTKRMETADKAKRAWVGPLLEGTLSGGLGLAGAMITAGELDSFAASLRAVVRYECIR